MAVKHQDKKALQIWSKEIAACGTGGTPGINSILVFVRFGLVYRSGPRRLQLVGQEELHV